MSSTDAVETADRSRPALALSGGGFRATLFHCGALMRLNELGLLASFERISSVSGGSIASGMLAAAWPRLEISNGTIRNLEKEVVTPLRDFCRRPIDTMVVGLGALLPRKSVGEVLADTYDELYGGMTLRDLPDFPQFVFNATNLQTGRLVRFQKVRLAEYTLGEIPEPKVRIALAVAASSAFPPVLSPVVLELDPQAWVKRKGAVHHGNAAYTKVLSLTDGGAYDNLGLETVDDFKTVVVSDAGAPFGMEDSATAFWPKQALRALDIATDQTRGLRKRLLFAECRASGRLPVYSGIDSQPSRYKAKQTLKVKRALVQKLASMRTRLNPCSDEEQGLLINWGWHMMDVAVRSHLATSAPPPTQWPIPECPLS